MFTLIGDLVDNMEDIKKEKEKEKQKKKKDKEEEKNFREILDYPATSTTTTTNPKSPGTTPHSANSTTPDISTPSTPSRKTRASKHRVMAKQQAQRGVRLRHAPSDSAPGAASAARDTSD